MSGVVGGVSAKNRFRAVRGENFLFRIVSEDDDRPDLRLTDRRYDPDPEADKEACDSEFSNSFVGVAAAELLGLVPSMRRGESKVENKMSERSTEKLLPKESGLLAFLSVIIEEKSDDADGDGVPVLLCGDNELRQFCGSIKHGGGSGRHDFLAFENSRDVVIGSGISGVAARDD